METETYPYDKLIRESETSWLLLMDGEKIWFPKSVCKIDEDTEEIECPVWLAIKMGLE